MDIMIDSHKMWEIFNRATERYHETDSVDAIIDNPYKLPDMEYYLFQKNIIDSIQWHLEDIIRNPDINPVEALKIKRRIDRLNQERTDMVEYIDSCLYKKYGNIPKHPDATINTETPAWAIDRLSILALKIYHMRCETERKNASAEHTEQCRRKLEVLNEQKIDLSSAIDRLIEDISTGKKYMKTYKQMKMYNDPNLNPELYNNKK
jgi:hypothetical protein